MLFSPSKGRPFGGRSFIISKKVEIINHDFINQHIATLSINSNNKTFSIIACYLPYVNGSNLNLSEFQSCLQVIKGLLSYFQSKMHSVLIIGDLNADLKRNKRFDVYLSNFIINNSLVLISPSLDINQYSYEKGDYTATLDHCISSNFEIVDLNCSFIDSVINLSDHKPLQISINWLSNNIVNKNFITQDLNGFKNIISIPPNFDNDEIKDKFNANLMNNISFYMNQPIEDNNKQLIIDNMYTQLTTSIVSAFKSCCRLVNIDNLKNKNNWFTPELYNLKKKMLLLRYKENKSGADAIKLKSLKYNFKKIMKNNIKLYEKNQYYKINHLIKINNSEKFFKRVNDMKKKNEILIDIDIDKIRDYYSSIFNKPLIVDKKFINHINEQIANLNHDNYSSIDININELQLALKETSISNVIGNDGVSSNMLLNCNDNFINSKLIFFYKYIFKYGDS